MGWLMWPPDVALNADVNCIEIAMEGLAEMKNPSYRQQKSGNQSAAKFRTFARDHNIRWAMQNG